MIFPKPNEAEAWYAYVEYQIALADACRFGLLSREVYAQQITSWESWWVNWSRV